MLSIPSRYRTRFLLQFTRELILNSANPAIVEQIKEAKLKTQKLKSELKAAEKTKLSRPEPPRQIMPRVPSRINKAREIQGQALNIPKVQLPERFKYLKPIATREELNLGKISKLAGDLRVKEIQCDGEGKEIIALTPMQQKTGITLTKEEIQQVLDEFSKIAKIPLDEGVVRIAAGNLILTAIISDIVGSKFIIRRIGISRQPMRR